jgi:hypothetical protein
MRHAVIVTHLMSRARTAAAEVDRRWDVDAPAEVPAGERHPGRFASLFRRVRSRGAQARTLGFRTESPGGGA